MNIRELSEMAETVSLSEYATKSMLSKGRKIFEEKCEIRTNFQRDRDRITHSKAFRRLMHKTQVFISPEGDHYRTRLTHTLEVAQISRTIGRALRLNEDLIESIALGHDLGHTPFGHTGEEVLDKIIEGGFKHNEQSIRIVEYLEKDGEGLNLSHEVLDGILNHRSDGSPSTLEGKVVQISDKIAYINHDIDDAIRAHILENKDLPRRATKVLGDSGSKRIDCLIKNIIYSSLGENHIIIEEEVKEAMKSLRSFLFDKVYLNQLQQKERGKIQHVINEVYNYYLKNQDELPKTFKKMILNGTSTQLAVCDYIVGMTDRYAMKIYSDNFVPIPKPLNRL